MTAPAQLIACDACPARRSTLPFDMADMIAVRLLPAQFARMVGVSKQSVSKWIRAGKVTLGPDGRLDPVKAIQEVLKNTAPTRLRARIFRQAMEGADAMRVEIRALQRKVAGLEQDLAAKHRECGLIAAEAKRQASAAENAAQIDARRVLFAYRREFVRRFDQLALARQQGWESLMWALSELESAAVPELHAAGLRGEG